MNKLFFLLVFLSFEAFADLKLPNPNVKIDAKTVQASNGNYPERRKLAVQFIKDYNEAYKKEFKSIYPDLPNPLEDDSAIKLFIDYTMEKATPKELDEPLDELQAKIKRELDKLAMRPILEKMTLEDLKLYVVEHEIRLQNLSDGILVPPTLNVPPPVVTSSSVNGKSGSDSILILNNPSYTKYAILASFFLSLFNIIVFLLKKK